MSLVAGLVLVALGLYVAVDGAGWARLDLRWFGPALLLGLGAAGLVVALRGDPD